MPDVTISNDVITTLHNGSGSGSIPLVNLSETVPQKDPTIAGRLDQSHHFRARIDQIREQASLEFVQDSGSIESCETPRILGFCAMLFVFGQVISLGALSRGHTIAFYVGLVFTAAGLSVGLVSFLNNRANRPLAKEALQMSEKVEVESEKTRYINTHRIGA